MACSAKHRLLLTALLAGGCESVEPSSVQHGDLEGHLSIQPALVPQGQSFTLRIAVVNPTDEAVEYRNMIGCAASIEFLRAGVDFGKVFGYGGGCPTAPYRATIAAGDSLILPVILNASAPRGGYNIRVTLGDPRAGSKLAAQLQVQ